jgi:GNAT superfamily N-acetyltransferase
MEAALPLSLTRLLRHHPLLMNSRPYVCNLLVDPDFRGKGYGRQLMQACEAQSQAWGQSEVYLHVSLALVTLDMKPASFFATRRTTCSFDFF